MLRLALDPARLANLLVGFAVLLGIGKRGYSIMLRGFLPGNIVDLWCRMFHNALSSSADLAQRDA